MNQLISHARRAVLVAAGLALALPATVSLAAPRARAANLPTIAVAMNGKTIKVGGKLVSGGVSIVSTVTREPMGVPLFIRLDPGVTVAQVFHMGFSSDPNNLDGFAAIVMAAEADRGTSTVQADLAAGKYIAFDAAGPDPGKWPHTTFAVATAAHPATLPVPKATMAAIEFGFRGPGTLHNGQLVRFANHGFLVHMIVAGRAKTRTDARRIAKLLRAGKDGQAGHLVVGSATFAAILSHGSFQQFVLHVHPGYWVLACFMDTQDGREHTRLGMERVIHITN